MLLRGERIFSTLLLFHQDNFLQDAKRCSCSVCFYLQLRRATAKKEKEEKVKIDKYAKAHLFVSQENTLHGKHCLNLAAGCPMYLLKGNKSKKSLQCYGFCSSEDKKQETKSG